MYFTLYLYVSPNGYCFLCGMMTYNAQIAFLLRKMNQNVFKVKLEFCHHFQTGEGPGLLRLHSTYRHDLKIYSSDEGRVQVYIFSTMSIAARKLQASDKHCCTSNPPSIAFHALCNFCNQKKRLFFGLVFSVVALAKLSVCSTQVQWF
jgi:hypothetical protein